MSVEEGGCVESERPYTHFRICGNHGEAFSSPFVREPCSADAAAQFNFDLRVMTPALHVLGSCPIIALRYEGNDRIAVIRGSRTLDWLPQAVRRTGRMLVLRMSPGAADATRAGLSEGCRGCRSVEKRPEGNAQLPWLRALSARGTVRTLPPPIAVSSRQECRP